MDNLSCPSLSRSASRPGRRVWLTSLGAARLAGNKKLLEGEGEGRKSKYSPHNTAAQCPAQSGIDCSAAEQCPVPSPAREPLEKTLHPVPGEVHCYLKTQRKNLSDNRSNHVRTLCYKHTLINKCYIHNP